MGAKEIALLVAISVFLMSSSQKEKTRKAVSDFDKAKKIVGGTEVEFSPDDSWVITLLNTLRVTAVEARKTFKDNEELITLILERVFGIHVAIGVQAADSAIDFFGNTLTVAQLIKFIDDYLFDGTIYDNGK